MNLDDYARSKAKAAHEACTHNTQYECASKTEAPHCTRCGHKTVNKDNAGGLYPLCVTCAAIVRSEQ